MHGNKAPKRIGGSSAPHDIYNRVLFARATASPDRVTKKDLEKGRTILSELSLMKPRMEECARKVNDGKKKEQELKKIAYGLAIIDFVEAINKHAEKSSTATSGEYQIFCSTVSLCAGIFKEDFFSGDLEKNQYPLYMVESALEACAEIYGVKPLLFAETAERYRKRAEEFVGNVEKEDGALSEKISRHTSSMRERLENDREGLRNEVKGRILELLEKPGVAGVKYQLVSREYDGASIKEPTEEFVLFGKQDKEKALLQKLENVCAHYLGEIGNELEFLSKMEKGLSSGLHPTPEEKRLVDMLLAGKHRERATEIRKH